MEIDFLMTYPCFVALSADGEPYTCNAEGDCCIAVFTDDDVFQQFVEEAGSAATSVQIENAKRLGDVLLSCKGSQPKGGGLVTHVIIDPTHAKRARVYPIWDFVGHIWLNPR